MQGDRTETFGVESTASYLPDEDKSVCFRLSIRRSCVERGAGGEDQRDCQIENSHMEVEAYADAKQEMV